VFSFGRARPIRLTMVIPGEPSDFELGTVQPSEVAAFNGRFTAGFRAPLPVDLGYVPARVYVRAVQEGRRYDPPFSCSDAAALGRRIRVPGRQLSRQAGRPPLRRVQGRPVNRGEDDGERPLTGRRSIEATTKEAS
jgi:hypothetical protein